MGRNDPCRQVRKRRAFAQLRRRCCCRGIRRMCPKNPSAACERARSVCSFFRPRMAHCLRANYSFSNCCGFGRDAMIHADRFANAERLLTVAAFAVYSQPVKCSFVSKLPTSIRRPVRAWLIANAQIRVCRALRNGLRVILPVSVSFFRRVVLRLAYAQGRPGQTRIPC